MFEKYGILKSATDFMPPAEGPGRGLKHTRMVYE